MSRKGLYIQLFSIHGLVRGTNLELGKNLDTGGQVKYVVELAKALGKQKGIERVDLVTRLISDRAYSPDYGQHIETISENVRIVRIRCGGGKYIRKELLWQHLDEFVDKTLIFIKKQASIPDVIHGHYAEAGYIAMEIANFLGVPSVFTGHSLGRNKKLGLAEDGLSEVEMNKKFRIDHRISIEENIIGNTNLIITSTKQEVENQYGLYDSGKVGNYCVIPPGIDTERFHPFYETAISGTEKDEQEKQAQFFMLEELERFLSNLDKPLILALSRPDRKKNISGLVTAYGLDKELQAIANLAVLAGIRKDISTMDDGEQEVLTELLLLMDKFDLYGKLAIPKQHKFGYEVPALYRIAASKHGVFVNPAFTEPFGLTLIEAAASGLPIVATDDGGPRDIIDNCRNGILVDVSKPGEISAAIKKIIVDMEIWKKYSNNGVRSIREHYSWDAHCKKYFTQLRKLPIERQNHLEAFAPTSIIGKRLMALKKLLITDIDNTLLGDDTALDQLKEVLDQHRNQIGFGVATGRTVHSTQRLLEKHTVPTPDLIISSVGTEIYYGPQLIRDNGWRTHVSFRWDREKIKNLLSKLKFLELQEEETQREFKLSYFMDKSAKNLAKVHSILRQNRLRYNLIYSSDQYLDILPYRTSKGKAVRYLCYKWNISRDQVLAAGDSGNDEEMLRGSMLGVVVGNHTEDLDKLRGLSRIYFSPAHYAAGILDGLRYYRFLEQLS